VELDGLLMRHPRSFLIVYAAIVVTALMVLPAGVGSPDGARSTSPRGVGSPEIGGLTALADEKRVASTVPSSASSNWTNLTAAAGTAPSGFTSVSMVYDAADGYLLAMAGSTWTFSHGTWSEPALTGATPTAFFDSSMAYDAKDGYVVLFGGYDGAISGDTWIFHGGNWTWWEAADTSTTCYTDPPTDLSTAPCPSPGWDLPMTYDAADQYVVLVDDGTWEFTGGNWSRVSAATVPGTSHSLVYDAADHYVLDWGDGTTYTYRAGNWTQLSPAISPSTRYFPEMAYDAVDGCVVLFGGSVGGYVGTNGDAATYEYLGDTWTFVAGNWTNRTSGVQPSPRADGVMAFDAADNYSVMFGGRATEGSAWGMSNQTWEYRGILGATATAHPTQVDLGMPSYFDGSWAGSPAPTSFSWNFGDGSTTSTQNAQHTYAAPGTYRATFYANSSANSTSVNSTVSVTVVPALGGLSVSAAPNPSDVGVPIHFTDSFSGGVAPFTLIWSAGSSDAFLDTTNSTVSYSTPGTYRLAANITDAVGKSEMGSVNITANPGPSSSGLRSSLNATDVGVPVTFSFTPIAGTPPYTYAWEFGVPGGSATGPSPSANFTYPTPGGYRITAWANDSVGASTTASMNLVVSPLPNVSIGVGPSPADAAAPVHFVANSSGGTGPFSASWSFGDGSTSSSLAPSHTFASPGNYTVSLQWTDSAGQSAFANSSLQVGPAVAVVLYVSNITPALGQSVLFTANVSGGHAPFEYVWSQLPPGCVSIDQPRIGCLPTQAGFYSVRINVSDAYSGVTFTTVNVTVIFDFTAAVTTAASVGRPLWIAVTPEGGIGTIDYSYSGLPSGCVSADVRNLTCVPTQSGQFQVGITVRDAAFDSAHHNVSVEIGISALAPASQPFLDGTELASIVVVGPGVVAAVAVGIWWFRRPTHRPPAGGA
jgi:PKD repeat protein